MSDPTDPRLLSDLNTALGEIWDQPIRDNAKAFVRGWLFGVLHPDADVEGLVGWIDSAPLVDVVDFISG